MGVSELAQERRKRAREAVRGVFPSDARPAAPWEADRATDDYGEGAVPTWREIDWPAHLRRTTVGGREIGYVDLGEGEGAPIVFVHGLGGNWQNWLENLPRAAQERRTIAMDLPGFGTSPAPAEEISISLYARLVDEFLEGLGIESAVVVGNSMGGFISAELALQSARVERLVLAAAAGISITNARRRPTRTMFRAAGAISAVALARKRVVVARPRLRHLILASVMRHPTRMRPDLLLEIMPGSNAPGFFPALDALLHYDFRDRLGEIRCPSLLVWGREDLLVPVRDADEFERLIPGSRKVVFDETGHVPMLERPRRFNDYLMDFVAEGATGERAPEPAQAVSAP